MAVEVTVIGNGQYAGSKSNIGDYTVVEDSTPIEASDSSGGTGQITFAATDNPERLGSVLLLNDTIKLTDGDRGDTEGTINSINGNNGLLSITADSRLGRLVIDVQADPVNDTFENVMEYYLSLGGITTGIAMEASLTAIPIIAQGWFGDLWTKIKELCVYAGAEISLVKGNVVIRPVRQRRALEINNVDESWTVTNIDLAKRVEVLYYNTEQRTNTLVYPEDGWNEDVTVYTVEAGTTLKVNIPVTVSLTSITQPVIQTFVDRFHSSSSVYAMAGNDGLPIQPAQWTADGGRLSVAIGEDGKSIDLTVTGASGATAKYAPYRIAVSSGPSDYYSSLRIIGSGVYFREESLVVPTGVDDAATSRDVGVTVQNIFVKDVKKARDIALNVAAKWSAPTRTISITKATINKPAETEQSYNYATFSEFDAYAATEGLTTFGNFDTEWSGDTFQEFDDYWYSLVANDFEFQVFGNANGARVQWRRAMFRIRSVNITAGGVTYTAEADTTFGDFDESAALDPGMTFSDFDTLYDDLTFNDFALIPLPHVKPEYDRS
jgi:hypothetical protein